MQFFTTHFEYLASTLLQYENHPIARGCMHDMNISLEMGWYYRCIPNPLCIARIGQIYTAREKNQWKREKQLNVGFTSAELGFQFFSGGEEQLLLEDFPVLKKGCFILSHLLCMLNAIMMTASLFTIEAIPTRVVKYKSLLRGKSLKV